MFENPRRGRQARNFTTNVPKIIGLKSSSEQIFSENCRWVPLIQVSKLSYLAKVLAALILHSYQNYALCLTSRFPLFHSRPMEWSEEPDVLFLREMLARNVFGTKKGSPARGLALEALVDSLNEIHYPKSCTRAVEPSPKKV